MIQGMTTKVRNYIYTVCKNLLSIYNEFANWIFAPMQRLVKPRSLYLINTNSKIGLSVVSLALPGQPCPLIFGDHEGDIEACTCSRLQRGCVLEK